MSNINNCPECGTTAIKRNNHDRTCRKDNCDIEGLTYLYYEWVALHKAKLAPPLTVTGQVNELMKGFA